MSYARFGSDSDVYIFGTVDYATKQQVIECCGCSLVTPVPFPTFTTYTETLAHLDAHKESGDLVPLRTYERIHREMTLLDDDSQRWLPN